jgi:hypothetical protein
MCVWARNNQPKVWASKYLETNRIASPEIGKETTQMARPKKSSEELKLPEQNPDGSPKERLQTLLHVFLAPRSREMQQDACSIASPWSALLLKQFQTPGTIGFRGLTPAGNEIRTAADF